MIMDAYEAYQKFLAIKLHFKDENYDYFKYHGKVRTNRSKFETRNDKYFYHKLSKKPKIELFLATNLKDNPDMWIGKIFDEEYQRKFVETEKRLQSLEYLFKLDMEKFNSLNDALVVNDGNYPKLLNAFNRNEIMPETMAIVNGVLNVFDYWDSAIDDTIIWPRTKQKLLKYSKFFSYDKNKYNDLLCTFT